MKTHPILFNTEMVQAILQGNKTQTRRTKGLNFININPSNWTIEELQSLWAKSNDFDIKEIKKPYDVGDILWVRETFAFNFREGVYDHKAHYASQDHYYGWKPSIHMPKAAARLFLQITDVRIERLNDISDKDSITEGIKTDNCEGKDCYYFYPCNDLRDDSYLDSPKTSFYSLWNSINGEKAWALNPWVWVIEFKQIEKPLNF